MKKLFSLLVVTACSLVIIAWCSSKNSVKLWDTISITYTATFSDGQIFEQTTQQKPLTFTVGSGQVIEWLDKGVIGMNVKTIKTITIKPEQWYGKLYNENNVQRVSKFIFDKLSITPQNWATQKLGNIEWIIKWTEKDENGNILVLFDINPRQTWDTLKYKVTILAKQQ
jgi:FKBP-type peptidyl-prolyl cis-trans isomerase 2